MAPGPQKYVTQRSVGLFERLWAIALRIVEVQVLLPREKVWLPV